MGALQAPSHFCLSHNTENVCNIRQLKYPWRGVSHPNSLGCVCDNTWCVYGGGAAARIGPPIFSRIGPPIFSRIGPPIFSRIGLPICSRIGPPIFSSIGPPIFSRIVLRYLVGLSSDI